MDEEKNTSPLSARERFHSTLKAQADRIKCVRNDVYTTKLWQVALNFALGIGAIVLVILSFVLDPPASVACLVSGLAAGALVLVVNLVLRSGGAMSFLQYTAVDGDKRYCYRIMSKSRAVFSDGENVIESDRLEYAKLEELDYPQYRYDFFADMDADVRIGKADSEIYKGTYTYGGVAYKCKMVFKGGAPYYGVIGGARIKYFDINSSKEKFVIPESLVRAAKALGVTMPKNPAIYVRNNFADFTRQ